jgi:hypothetical protein
MRTKPPVWAESLLRLFLRPDVFASVSGDLLEQYRDSILPARGLLRADRWYLTQALGFVLRKTLPWAALFAGAFLARDALDVLRPTTDFYARSQVSTALAAGLLLTAGFSTAWRSGSFLAGVAAGFAITATACILSIGGNAVLLALWHDAAAVSARAASGGIGEAFVLPAMVILPGMALGGVGGLLGAGTRYAYPHHHGSES